MRVWSLLDHDHCMGLLRIAGILVGDMLAHRLSVHYSGLSVFCIHRFSQCLNHFHSFLGHGEEMWELQI